MDVPALMAVYAKTRFAAVKIDDTASVDVIRVLVLQPAESADDLIECSLEECELTAHANYTALSYSWATGDGDASASRVIQLDDELHPVTENLYLALLRLRFANRPRRLWVDAVCIKQNDTEDKNRQVALMGQIYGLAQGVIAWLGEGQSDREDEAAFAAFQCIVADKVKAPLWSPQRQQLRLKHTWLPPPLTEMIPEQCTVCTAWDEAHPACFEHYGNISSQIPELRRAWMTLLRRRYFKRRWIIQEIHMPAPSAVTFMWNCYSLAHADFISGQDVPHRQIPSDVFQLRGVLLGLERKSLLHIMPRASNAVCSEPRDRVFALLSLAKDHDIKADYTRSVADVYTDFACLFIKSNRIQDMLRFSSGAQPPSDDPIPDLPSWVPDLREQFHLAPEIRLAVEGAWVHNSVFHVPLLRLGILGQLELHEGSSQIPVYDDVTKSRALLGHLKSERYDRLRKPGEGDILCTLEIPVPYMAGDEIRASASGFMLRSQNGRSGEESDSTRPRRNLSIQS